MDRICIIGGGVLETDGENYFVKAAIAEYLYELKQYFHEVIFISAIEEGKKYISKLDADIINIVPIGRTKQSAGVADVLKDLWLSFQVFRKCLDKNTGVIISGVFTGVLGRIIFAKLFAGRVIYYVGSDPKLTEKLKTKTISGYLKRYSLKIIFPLSVKISDGLLVRGQSVYKQAICWNKNIAISNPLISYSKYKNIQISYKKDAKEIFRILFVGKLVENKGVHILIEAFARLMNQYKDCCKLIVVGSGEEKAKLEDLTLKRGIQRHVKFEGYIDDMNTLLAFYRQSDVLVVPSIKAEGFPRVIEEAMVCGLPVICSRLGGMKEGLDEDDVIFVTPGRVDDLYTALHTVATDKIYRDRLRKKSLEKAISILSSTAAEQHAKFVINLTRCTIDD